MPKFRHSLIAIILCMSGSAHAQLSHEFTNPVHNTHFSFALDVAIAADGTVFLANGEGGLRAYTYDGSSFTSTANINNGSYSTGAWRSLMSKQLSNKKINR